MAQFKNNDFTHDTHDEHTLRVGMCIAGMDTYSGDIEFRGNLPDKMAEHLVNWNDIRSGLADEWGEQKGATVLVNLLKDELHELIIDCRYMLFSMLDEEELDEVTDSDIRKAYQLDKKIPKSTESKIELARNMEVQNQKYIDDASPWALPEGDFTEMAEKAVELKEAVDAQAKEILDVYHMNKMLAMERKRGNRLLSRAYKWIVAFWDDDDERLFAFGMVPKSAIWTPGSGAPEPLPVDWPPWPGPAEIFTAVLIEPGVAELVYSGVQEATIGYLDRRIPDTEDWILVADDLPMNPEDILPFRERHVPVGTWEYRFIPMRGVEKGVASFAIVEVTE